MDNKCFHCGELGACNDPEDEGHWAGQVTIAVGKEKEGAVNVDIYPHLFFNNVYLCDECKEELTAKIILALASAIEDMPDLLGDIF